MDIQEYISTGIIEAYVLGIATDEEVRELKNRSLRHPEIAATIASFEKDLEDYSRMQTVDPPAHLKEEIWKALNEGAVEEQGTLGPLTARTTPNVLDFENNNTRKFGGMKMAMAAAVTLLIGSVILNIYFWNQSNETKITLTNLQSVHEQFVAINQKTQQQLDSSNTNLNLLLDPAMKSIALAGVGGHVTNSATLLWDTRTKDIYISLNNLPSAPQGKQYQLWAIVHGKPVNLGVYSNEYKGALQKMNAIPNAEMFAVTLEKEGGSEGPTLDEMYVAGKV